MKLTTFLAALALAISLVNGETDALAQDQSQGALTPQAAFERLKTLAGEWEGTAPKTPEGQKVQVAYRVVSNGSVLVESDFPGTQHEMITVYHPDGDKLMMTHYCAMGNQPRMVMEAGSTLQEIRFAFAGGTNMNPEVDTHMHSLRIHLVDDNTVENTWTHFEGGKESQPYTFHLSRKP